MIRVYNDKDIDELVATLSGPACCYINDGDYDRCLLLPNGKCLDNDFCERTTAKLVFDRQIFHSKCSPSANESEYMYSGIVRMADEGNLHAMYYMLEYADYVAKWHPTSFAGKMMLARMINELVDIYSK